MKLQSYAPGNGAIDFVYVEGGKAVGHPPTIAEVANSAAWRELQANPYFRYVLQNFGTEQHPQVWAFHPVQRVMPNRLSYWAHGAEHVYRYVTLLENYFRSGDDWQTGRYDFYFTEHFHGEIELKNLSFKGALTFYLNYEEKCIEAMQREQPANFEI